LRFFCFGFGFGFLVDIFEQPNWTSQEFLEQKKKAEEEARLERERHEKERLLALKNKEKREQSAVASSEVKQRLQVRVTRLFFFYFLFRLNRHHNAPPKESRRLEMFSVSFQWNSRSITYVRTHFRVLHNVCYTLTSLSSDSYTLAYTTATFLDSRNGRIV
jgi:hypothetical protein